MTAATDYHLLVPTYRDDFNTCFYCGCIASAHDYAPPRQYLEFYLATREPSEFLQVPCCTECHDHLKACKAGTLDERCKFAKDKLAKKYAKALTIYEMWTEAELASLDFSLRHSIEAGLKLGAETTERLAYPGFAYEAAGLQHNVEAQAPIYFEVFGEQFTSFREALEFASKAYRIPKNTLKEYFADNDNNFELAIQAVHKQVAEKEFNQQLKQQCAAFAKQHKQAVIFVHKQVERYLSENDDMTISEALEHLYQTRIKPLSRPG
ncbi:hypothetical protein SAMN06297280_3510 [Arsukibacterium tuosuense]|uniref:Orphan protein n=1 Tax=Arsukibacterium tuosuense TaxID=1323745 RepID=A0A285JF15_9GAMM|nr:hypothetical protein [Arsukibacterium tuosuense]SNY58890.1 hypothetical protein SAMN06297280_3510 [Arsukibacterium tuosuense]